MEDLRQLQRVGGRAAYVDPRLERAVTPLSLPAWQHMLRRHPYKGYVAFILQRLGEGFRIGVDDKQHFESARRNMPSAIKNQQVINEYISSEVEKGNPFGKAVAPKVHINRFGKSINQGNGG